MLEAHTLSDEEERTEALSRRVESILAKGGMYALGEAYIAGEWQSDELVPFLRRLFTRPWGAQSKLSPRVILYLLGDAFLDAQRGDGAYEVARKHYDLGNDLFEAMLDRSMTYTCGYWREAGDLDGAQEAKLDLACRKLGLTPGMRVLDIGCGWGNFARFAAERYGVKVTGLTVSREQAELARERCRDLPVEIRLEDYRNFKGEFDRIVSIEMIEAVGRRNLPGYFAMAERCLVKGGLFLLQVISAETFSKDSQATLDQYILWLRKRIFPNGYLPKLPELLRPARGLFVLEDLHNFSADYAETLAAWDANFRAAWPKLKDSYGEPFGRMWRYYLCGCQALFRARMVQLYQIVYAKGGVPGGYKISR